MNKDSLYGNDPVFGEAFRELDEAKKEVNRQMGEFSSKYPIPERRPSTGEHKKYFTRSEREEMSGNVTSPRLVTDEDIKRYMDENGLSVVNMQEFRQAREISPRPKRVDREASKKQKNLVTRFSKLKVALAFALTLSGAAAGFGYVASTQSAEIEYHLSVVEEVQMPSWIDDDLTLCVTASPQWSYFKNSEGETFSQYGNGRGNYYIAGNLAVKIIEDPTSMGFSTEYGQYLSGLVAQDGHDINHGKAR